MDTEKLLFAYNYANKIAYRFEKMRYLRKDLVHEVILKLLEEPSKLDNIKHIKSWVYRSMRWKNLDMRKSNQERRTDNLIDCPIEYVENDSYLSWLDINFQYNLNCSECHTDIQIIRDYIEYEKFTSNKNTREVFNLMLLGYKPADIASKLNITQQTVNHLVCHTRAKLNQHFR